MPTYKSGPKRGQRLQTHQRNQAKALRKGGFKKKDASGGKSGGAAIGGGT